MKFLNLAVGLSVAIIGLVVAAEMLAGTYPTLITALTTLNNTSDIQLRTLIAPDGVLPIVVVAVFIIAVVVGLFALVKSGKR